MNDKTLPTANQARDAFKALRSDRHIMVLDGIHTGPLDVVLSRLADWLGFYENAPASTACRDFPETMTSIHGCVGVPAKEFLVQYTESLGWSMLALRRAERDAASAM